MVAAQVLLGADACRVLAQVFLLDGLLLAVDPSQLYDLPDNSADYVGTPPEPLTGDGVITYAEFKQLMTAQSATPRHLGASADAEAKGFPAEGKEEGKKVAFA